MLTREIFLQKRDLPRREVRVPELGGSVHVRTMTAGERDRFELSTHQADRADIRARVVAYSACDESGALLFSEADVPALAALPFPTLQPLFEAGLELNKFSTDDIDAAEKN